MNFFKSGCIFVFVLLFQCEFINSLKLPPYILSCRKDDVELNECAKRNGQAAISSIIKGDPKYRIPNMLPLKLEQIKLDASNNLKISVKDAEIFGLENAEIKRADLNLKKRQLKFDVYIPRAILIGEYDVTGRILILPIKGHGPANITIVGGLFHYQMDYILKERKKEEYMEITKNLVTYETKRIWLQLSNLFDGDQRLSDEMNKFMNENWEEVSKDLAPALTESISQIIYNILSAIMKKVPYNSIFTD